MSEFTRSVLVFRLSWKWIGVGLKKYNIFKSCTEMFGGINTELKLC